MLRSLNPVINRLESACYSSHFFAATLVSFWLTLYQTQAQSRETAFGQVRRSAVPGKYEQFLVSNDSGSQSMIFMWNRRATLMVSALLDSTGEPGGWRDHHLQVPLDDFLVVDLSREQRNVGVAIDKFERRISFITNLRADTLRSISNVVVPIPPTRVIFGDLNNDQKTDFIVADNGNPGVYPFLGMGNGKFRPAKVIAEDHAIADLKLTHLNNDNILDIVCYDWIRSRVHLLYGVGQGKFLDQMSYQVAGEVRSLEVSSLSRDGNLDIVLGYTYPGKIEILKGDGLGDFTITKSIALREPLLMHKVRDVNGDNLGDIVGIDGSSVLHVYLNGGGAAFDDRFDFVAGRSSEQFALVGGGGSGYPHAILLDRSTQELITLVNGGKPAQLVDSLEFATGLRPQGLTIADVDGDGTPDIALASAGSNSVSFFQNDGTGALYGPTSFSLPAGASDLAFHSLKDSTTRLLVSYPASKQVSVLALDMREGTATNATIATERSSEFLYWETSPSESINLFCLSAVTASASAVITLFQEIESHQFVEKSFRLPPTNSLLAAGVGLLNSDPIPDVAFVNRVGPAGRSELAVSYGDSLYSFRQKSVVYDLPGRISGNCFVWIAPVNRSERPDIVLYHAGAGAILERFRQVTENVFSRPDTVATDVRIVARHELQFVDFNGDGLTDIVTRDAAKGSIGWLKGNGTSFEGFRSLSAAPVHSRFALGRLNADNVMDVVVSFGDLGILRIYDGKLLLQMANEPKQ